MRPMSRAVVGALLSCLFLVAAGCGGPADRESGEGGGAFPVTVPNAYGDTVVKAKPKRVVSIGYHEHDILLALGARPVALQQWIAEFDGGVGPWAEPLLGDAKPVVLPSTATELNMGQIAKLRPDLIVGTYRNVSESDYELLSKMAPTLVRPKRYTDYAVPYDVETMMIGKALGKERQAKALVAATKRSFDDARKAHPEFAGKTAVLAYPLENGGLGVYRGDEPRSEFLTGLGFTVPKAVDDVVGDQIYRELSPERIDVVGDVDLLVIIDFGQPKDHFARNEVFQELDVAKRGHYVYPLPHTNAVVHNDVRSIPYCVDKLAPLLAETLEK
ncbi:MAG: ABC transporter substrate-binding protein [Streptosporangiales bacterium]|nr:ABC transporter substrate-binding protein [Streptosporangiales bacterium]